MKRKRKAQKKPVRPARLNLQQEAFVAALLEDKALNATAAAARAGYRHPDSQASRLKKKPQIAAAIKAEMEKRAARTGITQDRVLSELELLAYSDLTWYEVDSRGNLTLAPHAPAGAMRAVQSIKRKFSTVGVTTTCEVELKLWDKPGPLKLAGRHVDVHGFADRMEVSGPNGGPIPITRIETVIVDPKEPS